jgi:hypothetical protein
MSVGEWSGATLAWERELAALKERLLPVFGRREARETSGAFLDGLLSGIARKTGWQMAEQAGHSRPWRMQMLLGRTKWDADALGDKVRDYVVEALGDRSGVLVVDETGFVKKGKHSVGVNRQYSGTAGRIENSQIGVFVAYASRYGQALIDRQLYLPEAWASDPARRKAASVPEKVEFATKPAIARAMLAKALDAASPVPGYWPMPSMGAITACGGCWRNGGSPMCWQFGPIRPFVCYRLSLPLPKPIPRRWRQPCRPRTGGRIRLEKAPKACASTTGRASPCSGIPSPASNAGC